MVISGRTSDGVDDVAVRDRRVTASGLSPDALTPLLRARLDPGVRCTDVRRGAVGNGQETWFVSADGGWGPYRLVVRRSAEGGTLHFTERHREAAVMRSLGGSGLPVPRVHWDEGEESELGRPYLVMDRMPGTTRIEPADARALSVDLGRSLARLHRLGVVVPELGQAPTVAVATRAEVDRWRERYLAERLGPVPLLGALLAWLAAHVPQAQGPSVLLWGDPGPHNVLVEGRTITAMLDWELAHHGSPLEDVAAAIWACHGRMDPEALMAGYESVAGPLDRAALDYYTVLACVSRSVMLLAGNAAFVAGRNTSPVLAGLGLDLFADNLIRAAELLGWDSADPADPAVGHPSGLAAAERAADRLRPDAAETASGVARFLASNVLPALDDARLVRELKTAVALLEVVAVRDRAESALEESVDAARAGAPGPPAGSAAELEELAVRAEADPEQAGHRAGVRTVLVREFRERRTLLTPLTELYRR